VGTKHLVRFTLKLFALKIGASISNFMLHLKSQLKPGVKLTVSMESSATVSSQISGTNLQMLMAQPSTRSS